MKKLLFIVAAALCLSSCKRATVASKMILDENQTFASCQGEWKMTCLMKGEQAQTIATTTLHIEPSEEIENAFNIGGVMGENLYSSIVVSPQDGKIELSPVAGTKMGVPIEIAEYEILFSTFLTGVDSYSIGKFENQEFITLELKNTKDNSYAYFIR